MASTNNGEDGGRPAGATAARIILLLIGGGQLGLLGWVAQHFTAQTRAPGQPLNLWLAGWLFCGLLLYACLWLVLLYQELDGEG